MISTKPTILLAALLGLGLLACTDEPTELDNPPLPDGNASGGEDNTFDHPQTNIDPFELLERAKNEGPPRYHSRVHKCPKMQARTMGRILASRGVDMTSTAA